MSGNTHLLVGLGIGYVVASALHTAHIPIIAMSALGSLLPDIDTRSKISCKLKFQLPFKHRGFTHSLLFLLVCFLLCYHINIYCAIGITTGILSHIICDMLTGGVRLMYPKKKNYKI